MPPAKRQKVDAGAGKKRRKRRSEAEEELENGDDFFLTEAQDGAPPAEGSGEEEAPETAEEKRLRLAKAYLQQLRASGAADDEDERDEDLVLDDAEMAQKLRQQAHEAGGYLQRQIADRIRVSETAESSRRFRCHDPAVTALALTHDDSLVYSVGKEGGIVRLDVEKGAKTQVFRPGGRGDGGAAPGREGPEWVKRGPRQVSSRALLAAAVSSDGRLLAVGGGDRKVHVWDTRSLSLVQSFPGHKDSVTGLAFRAASHELYSCSLDRSVKLWSLDDRAYVDSLFGHQAEALCIDALRAERCVTGGHDRTCRVWKIPEESQLIYRAGGAAVDCCRYVTGTEWVTGSSDGAVSLWSQLKKKPAVVVRAAHAPPAGGGCSGPEAGWVQSVAVCRGSDLVASGAGDGRVRLWQVERGAASTRGLCEVGGFAAAGFVNALAVAGSGRFVVAGLGKEQRLGRWARYRSGWCGLLVQRLEVADEE